MVVVLISQAVFVSRRGKSLLLRDFSLLMQWHITQKGDCLIFIAVKIYLHVIRAFVGEPKVRFYRRSLHCVPCGLQVFN